jgi:hypothetical protein
LKFYLMFAVEWTTGFRPLISRGRAACRTEIVQKMTNSSLPAGQRLFRDVILSERELSAGHEHERPFAFSAVEKRKLLQLAITACAAPAHSA